MHIVMVVAGKGQLFDIVLALNLAGRFAAACTAGNRMASIKAIMAMTTSKSTRVNPFGRTLRIVACLK